MTTALFNPTAVTDALQDFSLRLGVFESVNGHEPKSAPGHGVTTAIWVQEMGTVPELSGLDCTAVRLAFDQRVYIPMIEDPQDGIDPAIIDATQQVMNAYSTGFTLDGLAFVVDILGGWGAPLGAKAGYINQDSRMYRAMVITLPIIFTDVFDQEA